MLSNGTTLDAVTASLHLACIVLQYLNAVLSHASLSSPFDTRVRVTLRVDTRLGAAFDPRVRAIDITPTVTPNWTGPSEMWSYAGSQSEAGGCAMMSRSDAPRALACERVACL